MSNIPQPIQDLLYYKVCIRSVFTYSNLQPYDDDIQNQIDIFRGLFADILDTVINDTVATPIV
jgi:hypothetical protein